MAIADLSVFLRGLKGRMAVRDLQHLSDPALVAQALAGQDHAPFEVILQRHGAMVYRVCRRVLREDQDAEDAFQATFLIMAQKLRCLRKYESLASWLHGVAYRVAQKVKVTAARRRRHEGQALSTSQDQRSGDSLLTCLDAELQQLPPKWKSPLILCYLEGKTQDEAARDLHMSKNTLRRRLEEARAALGRRLSRQGVPWATAFASVLVSDCLAQTMPPVRMITTTAKTAFDLLAGQPLACVASPRLVALVEGVRETMVMSKSRMLVLLCLFLGVMGLVGPLNSGPPSKVPDQSKTEEKSAVAPKADKGKEIYVIVSTKLFEVDAAFYNRLARARRLSPVDLDELERQFLDPPKDPMPKEDSLYSLLKKQKAILAGKDQEIDLGQKGDLLAYRKDIRCLPSPEDVRKGKSDEQVIKEGVSLHAQCDISADRRYVRMKLTQKSVELEAIDKVKVLLKNDGTEAEAEIPILKEAELTQVRDVPDGGSFLLPLQFRPRDARDKNRWLVVEIIPRIYIEEEERQFRNTPR